MKVVLSCQHCLADHQISETKVAGKRGMFRCQRCKALTPFSFVSSDKIAVESQPSATPPSSKIALFDLNFEQSIPTTPVRGQFQGAFLDKIKVYWFEHQVLFLGPEEADIFQAENFVSITGISDPKKIRGLQFDVRPSDAPNKNREINVSNSLKINSGYRLSLFVEDQDQRTVSGRLYFAIPDLQITYFYGSFVATRILSINFAADGSSDNVLPEFLSNYLTSKALLLSGNSITAQDSFNRLSPDEKSSLLSVIIDLWKTDSTDETYNYKFFEENTLFSIPISEKKMNEALVFLIANQVQVGSNFWSLLKKKIKKSVTKEDSYIHILTKRYPNEVKQIIEELSNRMVIPKDPSAIILRDDSESLKALLDSGFSANFVKAEDESNPLAFSILEEAVSVETSKCAWLLLEYGADPNYEDKISETAIFKLCQNNFMHLQEKIALMGELLKRGLNVNHQSQNKMSALHWCALFGEPSLAKRLIQAGIDVNLPDHSENTSLHEACKFAHSSVLALLLEAGAKPNLQNQDQKTGRDLAFEGLEIAQLEEDHENQERFERILSLLDVYGG
jgi:ankyrin repeat protein